MKTMTHNPVNLDERRDRAAEPNPKHPMNLQADEATFRHLQQELERLLLAAPVEIRPEVAAKAQSLTQLFAAPNHQSPRSIELIEHTLNDLTLLCNRAEPQL
jgi:hypothetical protein